MSSVIQQPDPSIPEARNTLGSAAENPNDLATWLMLVTSIALILAVAWPLLYLWFDAYTQSDSYYAYGPIVPLLIGVMLWHRRKTLQAVPKKSCFGAVFLLVPALGLLILANKREFEAVGSVGFILAVRSDCWLVLGTQWVRAAAFPLAFLIWMAPLPGPILHDGTYSGQQLCTVLANKTLHVLTFQTKLSGNMIALENFTMFVDVPCSGMKLLLTLLMFGAAFAWLTDGSPRRRLLLFLFTLPLSIIVNVVRITILGVVGECFGALAEHSIHDTSGLMTVGLGLVILFYLARRIGCRTFAGVPLF